MNAVIRKSGIDEYVEQFEDLSDAIAYGKRLFRTEFRESIRKFADEVKVVKDYDEDTFECRSLDKKITLKDYRSNFEIWIEGELVYQEINTFGTLEAYDDEQEVKDDIEACTIRPNIDDYYIALFGKEAIDFVVEIAKNTYLNYKG